MTPSPVVAAEVRALATRTLADCEAEQRAARDAMIRAEAHLDKYHELMALAARCEGPAR